MNETGLFVQTEYLRFKQRYNGTWCIHKHRCSVIGHAHMNCLECDLGSREHHIMKQQTQDNMNQRI